MNSTPDPEAAGFQVAIGCRGHLAYRAFVGTMYLETGVPLDDQTIWRLYR